MDKNELTKVLFPYAMEVAKAFKLSDEEQKIITGEVCKFRLSEIAKANEFMNTCIMRFIQDVAKNFTIEDLAQFVNTAFNVTKKTEGTQPTNDSRVSQEKRRPGRPRKNHQVQQKSFFDDPDIYYTVDERPGTARMFVNHKCPKHYTRGHITGSVMLYRSIDELKSCIPNVLDKDIYRIACMIPGECEYAGVPPMYYVSANGKNFSMARKSYREFARKYYETSYKTYRNATGYSFCYSLTCKHAYKAVK